MTGICRWRDFVKKRFFERTRNITAVLRVSRDPKISDLHWLKQKKGCRDRRNEKRSQQQKLTTGRMYINMGAASCKQKGFELFMRICCRHKVPPHLLRTWATAGIYFSSYSHALPKPIRFTFCDLSDVPECVHLSLQLVLFRASHRTLCSFTSY